MKDNILSLVQTPEARQVGQYLITFSITDLDSNEKVTHEMIFEVKLGFESGIVNCDDPTLSEEDKNDCAQELELILSTIDNKGLITLVFSHVMAIPDNYGELFDDQLYTESHYKNHTKSDQERVLIDSLLAVEYIPNGEEVQPRTIGFTWEVASYVEKTLKIQIIFPEARYVSTGEIADSILIVMQPNTFFVDRFSRNFNEVLTFVHSVPA